MQYLTKLWISNANTNKISIISTESEIITALTEFSL